jgi:hypothetical protein
MLSARVYTAVLQTITYCVCACRTDSATSFNVIFARQLCVTVLLIFAVQRVLSKALFLSIVLSCVYMRRCCEVLLLSIVRIGLLHHNRYTAGLLIVRQCVTCRLCHEANIR